MVVTEGGIIGDGFGKFIRAICDNNINQCWLICGKACWLMDNVFTVENVHAIDQLHSRTRFRISIKHV